MAKGGVGRALTTLILGAAGGWVASSMWAAGGGGVRPAAKEAIKAGLNAFERGRLKAAELSEAVSDLVAEADAERKQRPTADAEAAHTDIAAE
jgi:hypothetical protein